MLFLLSLYVFSTIGAFVVLKNANRAADNLEVLKTASLWFTHVPSIVKEEIEKAQKESV
jgi:hypothetical protein